MRFEVVVMLRCKLNVIGFCIPQTGFDCRDSHGVVLQGPDRLIGSVRAAGSDFPLSFIVVGHHTFKSARKNPNSNRTFTFLLRGIPIIAFRASSASWVSWNLMCAS